MRSAWLPTRSMSFDTLFDVSPNCLLALPTLLATFLTSTPERLGLRGTGTPRIFFWRLAPLSASPPATAAAVVPMATAGPATLDAALLTVSTTPLPDPFWLAVLRLDEFPLPLRFDVDLRGGDFRAVVLRALELPERDADERLLDAVLVRVPPPEAGFARLREDALLGLLLEREELLDERVLCSPPDVDLVAILSLPLARTCVV
jgi:hypothetical protein